MPHLHNYSNIKINHQIHQLTSTHKKKSMFSLPLSWCVLSAAVVYCNTERVYIATCSSSLYVTFFYNNI